METQAAHIESLGEEYVTIYIKGGKSYSGFIGRNPDGSIAVLSDGRIMIQSTSSGAISLNHAFSGTMVSLADIDTRMTYFGHAIPGTENLVTGKMYSFTSKSGRVYSGRLEGMTSDGNFLVKMDKIDGVTPPTEQVLTLNSHKLASINGKQIDAGPAPPNVPPIVHADSPANQPPSRPPVTHSPGSQVNNDRIYGMFHDQPALNRYGSRGQFGKEVLMGNGDRVLLYYKYNDREIALKAGKLFENVNPTQLPKGKRYTFAVTEDGQLLFGEVDNSWEMGVKHAHLLNGRAGVAGGEMYIDANGNITYNLLSGSITQPLIAKNSGLLPQMKSRMDHLFEFETGKRPAYTEQPILSTTDTPSPAEIRVYCMDSNFRASNIAICH